METVCFYVVRAEMLWATYSVDGQFCTGVCEEMTWARKAEESPMLEAVARKRLVKTQQAEGLAGTMVKCRD
jgi:hypothetical protein